MPSAAGQGTGLGLSMFHGFVQQSGGHVRLRSEVGQGTTATIYLPGHVEAMSGVVKDNTIARLRVTAASGVVLVVEDESDVRMVIRDILADSGYTVLEGKNGPSGLNIADSRVRIDLLEHDCFRLRILLCEDSWRMRWV